ncbi:glycosyltransferase family 4 protein [Larsenimonas salina]|uniref:glycosyltransferase family 4 protein n=1 Tax=Larsenimonas salina TaxID=1295565 RepID=UPI0020744499|nr:glycosyltransferase family 4 protein [Larsenimonas salina]MCM5703275.1 glycosyltransferase family 4 protein [Larsenimonas salina]
MSDKLAVLYIIPRYWPAVGGAELHTRELLKHSEQIDATVACIAQDSNSLLEVAVTDEISAITDEDGPAVVRLRAHGKTRALLSRLGALVGTTRWVRPLYTYLLKKALRPQLERLIERADAVHVIYNGMTGLAELAEDIARERQVPFIFTPLCGEVGVASAWTTPRFKRLYRRAQGVIGLTAFERDWLVKQGAASERTHIIPVSTLLSNTFDADEFRRTHDLGEAPVLLFLGRHDQLKGVHLLHNALGPVWERVPELHVVMMGPEGHVQFEHDHSDDPRLIRISSPSQHDKASALAACDLLCVPSLHEGLGVVFLEAWSFEKPVIALDLPVLKEVIGHKEAGLLGRLDGKDLHEKILLLLNDSTLRHTLGREGHRRLTTLYHWPALTQRLEALYTQLVSSRSR